MIIDDSMKTSGKKISEEVKEKISKAIYGEEEWNRKKKAKEEDSKKEKKDWRENPFAWIFHKEPDKEKDPENYAMYQKAMEKEAKNKQKD
jgi:hypothetical protein